MSISTKALRRSLFVATSVGAIAISSPAMAETCFLDRNDNGTIDPATDDDGDASSEGLSSLACGVDATATEAGSTATGNRSAATGLDSTATGVFATANGRDGATATGAYSAAGDTSSTATGAYSSASGYYSTATGGGQLGQRRVQHRHRRDQ